MCGQSRFGEGRAFKTKGKVFLYMDQPRLGNNIYFFLCYCLQMRIGLVAIYVCMPSAGFRQEIRYKKCQLRIQD